MSITTTARIAGFCCFAIVGFFMFMMYDAMTSKSWREHDGYSIPLEAKENAAQFVVNCARAANPHSDEEGEDLVAQCEQTAKRMFGVFGHGVSCHDHECGNRYYVCGDSRI
ncbi:MAG: hypothetical protein AABY22_27960, partial [Nanoarchaeota archaeon]